MVRVALVIRIESDAVINYCFPKTWPTDREVRASIMRRAATRLRTGRARTCQSLILCCHDSMKKTVSA